MNSFARRGLKKIGNALIPGGSIEGTKVKDQKLPSFSKLGCDEYVHLLMNEMPTQDQKDLTLLLSVLSLFPTGALKVMFGFLEWICQFQFHWLGPLKLVRLGLKGLVVSLYYSGFQGKDYNGPLPLEVMGYQVSVYCDDLEKTVT